MSYLPRPKLECDIVMKGGITSGVIYPRAACELARTYRLRSVGGSSAGAIAAAGAAAAEFGRDAGGFDLLESLPTDITAPSPAGGSVLLRLFQPMQEHYSLYRAFTAGMGSTSRAWPMIRAVLAGFWVWAVAGALLGLLVIVAAATGDGVAMIAGLVSGLVLVVLGVIVGVAAGVARKLGGVAATGFGLCTGMPGAGADGADALTPWLHGRFQSIAGLGLAKEDVLTFGKLAVQQIELRTMTTNLTRRQPMAMPWRAQEYFFEPDEMRKLFPAAVVEWMVDHPPENDPDGNMLSPSDLRKRDLLRAQAGSRRPWPAPDDVPVLVATRMSLSFPILIAAVRLYAVDYALDANRAARAAADAWLAANPDAPAAAGASAIDAEPTFGVNWFSDGGICANLPVHFFDSPLPTRPTFAIDLEGFPADRAKSTNEAENCNLPIPNNAGLLRPWTTLPSSGVGALGSFISQVVDTARGWVDAGQLVMPGYRDRVVTIYHDDAEGGMNLAMPAAVVESLANRGAAAGGLLVDKFVGTSDGSKPQGWGWSNQRWVRLRTATAGLRTWLVQFQGAYTATSSAVPYPDLAGTGADGPLPSYDFGSAAERAAANAHVEALIDLADSWQADGSLLSGAPRPRPRIRLVPDDGTEPDTGTNPAGAPRNGTTSGPGPAEGRQST